MKTYKRYSVDISYEPSYYRADVTDAEAVRIASALAELVEAEFPGIKVFYGPGRPVCGPEESVCAEIREWIHDNWISAL